MRGDSPKVVSQALSLYTPLIENMADDTAKEQNRDQNSDQQPNPTLDGSAATNSGNRGADKTKTNGDNISKTLKTANAGITKNKSKDQEKEKEKELKKKGKQLDAIGTRYEDAHNEMIDEDDLDKTRFFSSGKSQMSLTQSQGGESSSQPEIVPINEGDTDVNSDT